MTKDNFLKQLNIALARLPEIERNDILQDYEDHFTFGLEAGKTEAEIAESLGSPTQLAKELLADYHVEKVTINATTGNILRAIWATIGLGFFNLVIVLGPAIALAGIIFSGWVMGVTFIASPLLVIANTVVHPGAFLFFDLFFSLALCGVGCFIVIIMFYITKFVKNVFIRYLKFNMSLVKGGLKRDE